MAKGIISLERTFPKFYFDFLSFRTYQGDELAGLHDGSQVLSYEIKSEKFFHH